MKLSLRAATPADLPTIVRQRHAMFEAMGYVNRAELELTDARFEEWVTDKLANGEYRGWFLQDEQGNLVAGAGLWVMEWVPHAIDRTSTRGNILNVYAEPEYTEFNLTRRLIIHILDFCRDNGIRTVISNPGEALRPVYDSLGFRSTGELRIQLSTPN